MKKAYKLHDEVMMKKRHPCGSNRWIIIRMGADIRIKCIKCNRSVMMPRNKFENSLKAVFNKESEEDGHLKPKEKRFRWPSIDVAKSEVQSTDKLELDMPNQSELYKLGYKITGLNRSERWKILNEKVLPSMSVEKIVNTIASHVRNRKRQHNGHIKYKYAIQEWEHDLERLKKEFYK